MPHRAGFTPKVQGFRYDIQGLRALAVSLVVIFHLWPGALTGGFVGVDVFFVISGYLITAHLVANPPRTVRDLASFWGRRIRRLLPAAFLVLLVTAVAARILAPSTQWAAIAREIIASALYVENWALASASVDYLAAENAPTPSQHFWSLSVEEQFYLFWPLVILAGFWLARKWGANATVLTGFVMLGLAAVSLAVSVHTTASEPASAYFITPARIWELAVGGLVAVIGPWAAPRLAGPVRILLAWTGIAGILLAGFTYDGATPFPGYTALLPVLGTALVILPAAQDRLSPTHLLRAKPLQWLGDVSYSVYLWHWPLIMLLPYATGGERGWLENAVIVVLTVVLAWLTKTCVEDKFRSAHPSGRLTPTYRFAAAGMIALTVLGSAQLGEVHYRQQMAGEQLEELKKGGDGCLGAAAIASGDECPPDNRMIPEPAVAKNDRSDAYRDNCWSNEPFTERPVCTYGNGDIEIALVGNSHAGHWLPALQVLAERHNWTITTFLVSRCNPTDAQLEFDTDEMTENCHAYGEWVMEQTKGKAFDLVITSERQSVPVHGTSWETTEAPAVEGYKSYLKQWADAGTKVLVIKDPPYPGNEISSIPDCLAAKDVDSCSGTPESWHWMDPLDQAARELAHPHIHRTDMDEYFCTDGVCPAVVGSVVTYFDGSHITATYARTLAPYLQEPIEKALAGQPPTG